jgi:hypothetical protein
MAGAICEKDKEQQRLNLGRLVLPTVSFTLSLVQHNYSSSS